MNRTILTLLTGIAIGVLVAPRKGSETWEKITGCLDDLKNKASELQEKAVKKVDELKQ